MVQLAEDRYQQQVSRILHELAHELGNAVHLLRLIREIMNFQQGDLDLDELRKILDAQFDPFSRMIGMLRRLGETLGPWQAKRDEVDPGRWLNDVTAQVVERHGDVRSRLQIQLPEGLGPIRIDPRLATILLVELLDNALRFSPAQAGVQLEVRQSHEALVLTVDNPGAGIAADLRPHLFQPFVCGQGAPDVHSGHLGLGLARVRLAAEAHGGRVEAPAPPREAGCRMVATLPVA